MNVVTSKKWMKKIGVAAKSISECIMPLKACFTTILFELEIHLMCQGGVTQTMQKNVINMKDFFWSFNLLYQSYFF